MVLAGYELGLGPMQSLQSIDLIKGQPTLSPEGMRALVLARGHAVIVEAGDQAATVQCHRREWPAEQWTSFTFDLADAERAHLLAKDNWVQYPRAMLTARATSEACRATFPDVIAGLSYTAEEVESMTPAPPPRAARKRPDRPAAPTTPAPAATAGETRAAGAGHRAEGRRDRGHRRGTEARLASPE